MQNTSQLTIEQLRALYDQDQRFSFVEPGVRREVTPHTVRQINLREPESFLLYSRLDASNVEQVIAEEIAYFESIGHDFEWKLYSHDTPPDLLQRLRARGFAIEDEETILVLDMNDSELVSKPYEPVSTPSPTLWRGGQGVRLDILSQPSTYDIRRIHDPAEIDALMVVPSLVFGGDFQPMAQRLKWELTHYPDYISIYAAYVEGVLVASARVYFPAGSPFASLWGGATLPAYRGQGIYTALVAARAQEALARGRQFLTIDASPMSRPIVEKLGFVAICTSTPCVWERADLLRGEAGA